MESKSIKRPVLSAFFRAFLFFSGAALALDALIAVSRTAKINMGIIMPFVIGVPLLIVGIFFRPLGNLCKRYKLFRFLKWAMIAVYALFSLLFAFTTTLILVHSAPIKGEKPDTVIVLGAGIRGSAPSATLAYRLEKALEYANEVPDAVIIVSGGQGANERYTEAQVMSDWLIAHGADAARILLEDRSKSTEENFIFSRELIENELGKGRRIAFVSSRFHVFRAGRIAKKLGIEAKGIAAREYKPLLLNDYMRECAAIVQYFFTGRL